MTNSTNFVIFEKGSKIPSDFDLPSYQPQNDWSLIDGQNLIIKEPDFPKLGKKIFSSGLIVFENDDRVWLVKPANGYGGYNYTFPKGRVEDGLNPQANAIKETFEESGLKCKITGYAGDYPGDNSITRYYYGIRTAGNPCDYGWESEAVALVPLYQLSKFLNKKRDLQILNILMGL